MELNTATQEVAVKTRRIIALQAAFSVVIAGGFYVGGGERLALSAFYGGSISIVIAFLLGRGVMSASSAAQHSRGQSMGILYLGAALRFILVLILFGVALGVLKLDPLATVSGFIAAQMAYLVGARSSSRANDGKK